MKILFTAALLSVVYAVRLSGDAELDTDRVNLSVLGHSDENKSTSTGHLIYKNGGIDERAQIDSENILAQVPK